MIFLLSTAFATDLSAGCPVLSRPADAKALYESPPSLPIDYADIVALVATQTGGGVCDSSGCSWSDGSVWTVTGTVDEGSVYVRFVGVEAALWRYSALDAAAQVGPADDDWTRSWSASWSGTPFRGLPADSLAGTMESSTGAGGEYYATFARSTVWLGDCWGSVDTATYEGDWPAYWISVSAGGGDASGEHGAEVYLAPGYCLGDADYVYGSFDGAAAELLSAEDWTPSGEVDADGDHWPSVCGDCDDADPEAYPDIYTTPYDGPDADCDGVTLAEDCDDSDAAVNPDEVEIPADGIDQDCSGADYVDADGDGFDANGDQDQEELDCNDADPAIHPGASDVHNDGIDQDCTGSDFIDEDGDGYDASDDDCDDHNPSVHPRTPEVPCNGLDDDCRGGEVCDEDPSDTGTDTATGDPPPPSGHRGCASAPVRPSPSALLLLGLLAWRARRAAHAPLGARR